MHNNYLMGLKFGTSWRVALTKKKIPYGDLDFMKNGYKSIGSSVRDFLGKFGFFFRARSARRAAKPRAERAKRA